ncbi:mitotic spindle checkpoint MAD2 [Olea europaea subsp. europaea]|uniref:Mitotic spindle checkpoint MAD2 n=1 Tax=Olea europaea subsp. europaea TaxID=158383 RepID=A0A8S0V4Q0_OLEEU|nr:mitotic spindle checkpoint MAD2 [Olea europaea subsp. europaea]
MASRTATKDIITLRGSAAIVSEFFGYAANSILYNRGTYPEESFAKVKKYGLPMLLTKMKVLNLSFQKVSKEKSDKEMMREIQAIMRQIASSITYLPCLDEPCVFDVLAYTDKDVAAQFTWMESDPKLFTNPRWLNCILLILDT